MPFYCLQAQKRTSNEQAGFYLLSPRLSPSCRNEKQKILTVARGVKQCAPHHGDLPGKKDSGRKDYSMLDWLKEILGEAYTGEIEKQISEQIGKAFVSKADFNAANEEKKTLKETLAEANKTIEEFKDMDIEGIKRTADEWKEKAVKAETDAKAKIDAMQFDYALDSALSGAKAKNAKAVKALLDVEGLKLNNGEIVGLSEQLEKLKADSDYLFEGDEKPPKFADKTQGAQPANDDIMRSVMGLPPEEK